MNITRNFWNGCKSILRIIQRGYLNHIWYSIVTLYSIYLAIYIYTLHTHFQPDILVTCQLYVPQTRNINFYMRKGEVLEFWFEANWWVWQSGKVLFDLIKRIDCWWFRNLATLQEIYIPLNAIMSHRAIVFYANWWKIRLYMISRPTKSVWLSNRWKTTFSGWKSGFATSP